MRTFVFDFKGMYPVGAYVIATSTSMAKAKVIAQDEVRTQGFDPETVEFIAMGQPNESCIIANGDY